MTTHQDTVYADGFVGDLVGDVTGKTNGATLTKFSETIAFGDFTDGGGAAGTIDLTNTIPAGAIVLYVGSDALTGFAGDVSATIQIGDGSDVDRYNTGTPDVFSDVANGIDLGNPSGDQFHDAEATVTVTITADANWGDVDAGEITLEFYYLS